VKSVVSGYAGGTVVNPDYETVSNGRTGHAEVVKVTFDPAVVSYETLLAVFFTVAHNPTELNRQGPDVGTQYRSVVFWHDSVQESVTLSVIEALNASGKLASSVVTQVAPLVRFFPAEDYHQDYFRANPYQPYCQVVVAPKVAKLLRHHPELADASG
jgi:peptide-methionine (S)-S-oxide reductase